MYFDAVNSNLKFDPSFKDFAKIARNNWKNREKSWKSH